MNSTTTARVTGSIGSVTVAMTVLDCPECAVIFAITGEFEKRRRSDGASFCCPSGHSMSYAENEVDRLRKQLKLSQERIRVEADNANYWRGRQQSTAKSLRATKAAHTRTKNRVARGVCPCCNRHFVNVERHMAGQHPDFNKQ